MPRNLPRSILDLYSLLVRRSNKTPRPAARRAIPYGSANDVRSRQVRRLPSLDRTRTARQILMTGAPWCGVLLLCLALSYIAAEVVGAASSAHTPSVTNATTNEDTQTTSGLVISRNPLDGSEVTHFKIGNIVGGQLFKHDGTTQIPINSFITFAEGNAGLKFTPSPNNWGTLTIEVYSSTSASDAGVGGIAERPLITVTPLGDTPSVTSATTNKNTQSRFGLVIRRNPVDGIEINYLKITNIQNGTLFKHDGTTQINAGDFITFDDEGSAGLKFTPANNLTSPSSTFGFDAQASSSNSNAGLGGSTAAGSVGVYIPIVVTVNALGDAADSNIGDGHCDTDGNLGNGDQCTLRAAIQETNSAAGDDTITFSLPANSTITINTALPDLNSLTMAGPGATSLTVRRSTADGTPDFRVFTISDDHGAIISGLTVFNGRAVGASFPSGLGGGILNNNGTLSISNCVINGNSALTGGGLANLGALTIESTTIAANNVTGSGGGISNSTGATQNGVITISNSTISNNSGSSGGGIFNIGQGSITNSTISGNTAATGGGINNFNPLTLANVTISGNTASNQGGGIYNPGIGIITFGNTLIAGNTSPTGPDCSGFNLNSQDYNLIGNTSGGNFTGTTTHNITNVNAVLGPLAANGGSAFTHALLVGSPAIDAANSSLTTDQRGQPRPIDDQTVVNAAGGNAADIGAYEAHNLEVNSLADTDDGLCRSAGTGNGCTLREAINAANAGPGAEVITFAPGLVSGGPATISLLTALAALSSDMNITGPGSSLLRIQRSTAGGTPDFRIFTVAAGASINISLLTVSNGRLASGNTGQDNGGGIHNSGTLILVNSDVSNNTGDFGAGIYNLGSLTIIDTSISNNSSIGGPGAGILSTGSGNILNITSSTVANNTLGGGIFIGSGTATINNSTVSNNTTQGSGGGILSGGLPSTILNITNTTITGNRADSPGNTGGVGGGIERLVGTVTLRNTIVAGNFRGISTTADDIFGTISPASSFNLIGDGTGLTGVSNGDNGNQVGTSLAPINPRLGTLANNGGPTKTHELLSGSTAVDAGNNCVLDNSCTPALAVAITTDQRGPGFNRAADGTGDSSATVDIGAYELQSILVTNTADSGAGSLRQAITDANANGGTDSINFQAGLAGTITLSTALPNLSSSMSINGPGANQLTIRRSTAVGTPNFRVFTIDFFKTVSMSGLTIANGFVTGINVTGGGINNSGTLTMTNCNVYGNSAIGDGARGGGIYSDGPSVTLIDCSIGGTGVGQPNVGGGILAGGGTLWVTGSLQGIRALASVSRERPPLTRWW